MSKKFSRFQMLIQNYLKSKYDISSYLQFKSIAPLNNTCILVWQGLNRYNWNFCRSTNTNGVDFLEEKVFQPVTKFVDSLGIEEKLARIKKLYYYKLLWRSNFILNILIKRKYLSRKVLDIHKRYGDQDIEESSITIWLAKSKGILILKHQLILLSKCLSLNINYLP